MTLKVNSLLYCLQLIVCISMLGQKFLVPQRVDPVAGLIMEP